MLYDLEASVSLHLAQAKQKKFYHTAKVLVEFNKRYGIKPFRVHTSQNRNFNKITCDNYYIITKKT